MHVCVVVPSEADASQAGVRIRYQRLAAALEVAGHRLTLEPIDGFRSKADLVHDAYVLSKCYDARCHVLAALLDGSPRLLGVDLFDDYFSQGGDSRLRWMRDWLRSLAPQLDLVLCSTPRLQEVAAEVLPGVPSHRVADPAEAIDAEAVGRALRDKLNRARETRRITVAWFGMGDHPQFPIGLHDLHAFSAELAALQRSGWHVDLQVLTHPRALTPVALEKLARLPVHWRLAEWSIEAEAALLAESLVVFLPVNAQPFAIAKSTNRAVTALASGTQVLSVGHPLYASLGRFVYRHATSLVDDLADGRLRLREDTCGGLLDALATEADGAREAAALIAFLEPIAKERQRRPRRSLEAEGVLGVLHGVRSDVAVHRMAQRARHLSIATPYANPSLNVDLRWVVTPTGLQAQFANAAAGRVRPEFRRALRAGRSPAGRDVQLIDVPASLDAPAAVLKAASGDATQAARVARHAEVVRAATALTQALLAGTTVCLSESEAPFGAHLAVEHAR